MNRVSGSSIFSITPTAGSFSTTTPLSLVNFGQPFDCPEPCRCLFVHPASQPSGCDRSKRFSATGERHANVTKEVERQVDELRLILAVSYVRSMPNPKRLTEWSSFALAPKHAKHRRVRHHTPKDGHQMIHVVDGLGRVGVILRKQHGQTASKRLDVVAMLRHHRDDLVGEVKLAAVVLKGVDSLLMLLACMVSRRVRRGGKGDAVDGRVVRPETVELVR